MSIIDPSELPALSGAIQEALALKREQEALAAERRRIQELQFAEEQEERLWCRDFGKAADGLLTFKGRLHKIDLGPSHHTNSRLYQYWKETPEVKVEFKGQEIGLVLSGHPRRQESLGYGYSGYSILARTGEEREDVENSGIKLFEVSDNKAQSWTGKASPTQRILARQILTLLESSLQQEDQESTPTYHPDFLLGNS